MRNFLLRLIVFLMVSAPVFAQSITGVVSSETGELLPGVSVVVKGSNLGTITDTDGKYSISTNGNSTLVFSFIGFKTQEVPVGSATKLDVKLISDSQTLGEVVVTALGIQRESKQLGYAVQKVDSKDIMKVAPPSLGEGLIGKVAGMTVSVPNGIEGSSQRIVIRGNNSLLGNNQPLIVIDGVQVQDNSLGQNANNGSGGSIATMKDWGSYLNFINSADVEDVNVLKGPSAAALYGAKGANGVILITTKKGVKKPGLGIDYNFSTRFTDVYRYQDFQNEYGYGGAIGLWSANKTFPTNAAGEKVYPGQDPWQGITAYTDQKYFSQGAVPGGLNSWNLFSWYGTGASWGPKLDGTEITWWDGVKRKWEANPDNIKSFFRQGNTTSHNVSFSGGGEFGSVRVSISNNKNKAVIPNSNFEQNTVNLGSNIKISKKVTAEATASYTNFNRLNTPNIGDDNSWTKFLIYGMSRDYKNLEPDYYKLPDGSKNLFNTGNYTLGYPYGGYGRNIYWNTYENNTKLRRDQLLGSVKLSADLLPWLNLMARTGIDYNTNEFETKNKPIDALGVTGGSYGLDLNKNYTMTTDGIATAHTDRLFVDGLTTSLTAGVTSSYNRYHGVNQTNNGPFSIPFQYFLSNTTTTITAPTEYRSERKSNGLYGILNVGWKDYLFLEVTARNDWSSTLPAKSNSFFYPSASLSYVFTEAMNLGAAENWLDFGKLRFALGNSANATDPYMVSYVYNSGAFGGSPTRSLQTTLPPLELEPQRSSNIEVGTQLGFLKGRLGLDFTFYHIKSTNQILSAPLAVSSGVSGITFNTGELTNTGFDLILRGTPIKSNGFTWDVTLNGAHNVNKIISLSEGVESYPLGDVFGITYGAAQEVRVGQKYGTIYGFDYRYNAQGKKMVERIMSGDQIIGSRYVTTEKPVAIGNSAPFMTGGLGNNFRYKNFSVYALIDFKLGGDLYSSDYAAAMGNGLAPETLKERNGGGLSYTYPDGTVANHGVILDGVLVTKDAAGNYIDTNTPNTDVVNYMFKYASVYSGWSDIHLPRSAAVFENSWAKLREFSINYDVPKSIVQKTKIFQGLSVSLIGRDLFYLFTTLPDNLNPEGVNGIGNAQGLQWSAFPGQRSYGFTVKAQF